MPDCHFCYKPAVFYVTFSKGREVDVCADIYCIGRLPEVAREEQDNTVHAMDEIWEYAYPYTPEK